MAIPALWSNGAMSVGQFPLGKNTVARGRPACLSVHNQGRCPRLETAQNMEVTGSKAESPRACVLRKHAFGNGPNTRLAAGLFPRQAQARK